MFFLFGYPCADQSLLRKPSETYFPRITDELNSLLTSFGSLRALFTIDSQAHSDEARKYDDPIQEKVVVVQEEKRKILVEGEEEVEEKVKDFYF